MHSVSAFYSSPQKPEIIVVLNDRYFDFWNQLCKNHAFDVPHQLVAGGETRFASVKNALGKITEKAVVAIHDAVRPLIRPAVIDQAFQQALVKGNAVVAVPSKDSVRWCNENGISKSLNRSEVFLVQTPQVFQYDFLQKAYQQEYQEDFTDDASVVEHSGAQIHLLPGDQENFKITYPSDLHLAELILNEKNR